MDHAARAPAGRIDVCLLPRRPNYLPGKHMYPHISLAPPVGFVDTRRVVISRVVCHHHAPLQGPLQAPYSPPRSSPAPTPQAPPPAPSYGAHA